MYDSEPLPVSIYGYHIYRTSKVSVCWFCHVRNSPLFGVCVCVCVCSGIRGQQPDQAARLDQEPSDQVSHSKPRPRAPPTTVQTSTHIDINFLSLNSEFSELDPEKLKLAVKKFTHSCAGYSVATYVLVGKCIYIDNHMTVT